MTELEHKKWVGTTYGNGWMHRWLIRFLRVIDVRLLYIFAYIFIVPPTILVNSNSRKVAYRFFRDRFGQGRLKAAWNAYRNHCVFAEVVIDRFAMYAGKKFKIEIEGYKNFEQLEKQPGGFIQVSSHIGNYELAGYSLRSTRKRFNALVFGGEKASVMANRSKLFDKNNIRMIPMMEDMSHIFEIRNALDAGEILSMPADRVFGSQKAYRAKFLGAEAEFPQGPFVMAASCRVPILFVAVMKSGWRKYNIIVKNLDSGEEQNHRKKAAAYFNQYVLLLEDTVKRYPLQWYNYFDFWQESASNKDKNSSKDSVSKKNLTSPRSQINKERVYGTQQN